MRYEALFIAMTALLSGGCALGPGAQCPGGQCPGGQCDRSVTHDVVGYLQREWPLAGPPVIPAESCPAVCGCHAGGHHPGGLGACGAVGTDNRVWRDDWNQPGRHPHATAASNDPPPAAPLDPPPPGRFFPAPVRPVFASQGPASG